MNKQPKSKTAVITGAGSGIGQVLAWNLAEKGLKVFIIGRGEEKLIKTKQKYPSNIEIIVSDIATEEGRLKIQTQLKKVISIDYIVHNAATEEPIKPFKEIKFDEWRYCQATNVEAPLFLTQNLLNQLTTGSRILMISSGLAHEAMEGVLSYCTSKAALHMLFKCLNLELRSQGILVGCADPGIVDTSMQTRIRKKPATDLKEINLFHGFKETNQLVDPNEVAIFLVRLLLETSDGNFTSQEWRMADYKK